MERTWNTHQQRLYQSRRKDGIFQRRHVSNTMKHIPLKETMRIKDRGWVKMKKDIQLKLVTLHRRAWNYTALHSPLYSLIMTTLILLLSYCTDTGNITVTYSKKVLVKSVKLVCHRHWVILMRRLFGEAIKRRISSKGITTGDITSSTKLWIKIIQSL